MSPRIAAGTRDTTGRWVPDDPGEYPPLDVHGIWPWSVLDQSTPAWKSRKAHWQAFRVDDLAPRAHASAMIATGRHGTKSGGVSAFDPLLAELAYTWFCPPGGTVLDPMAGGPVRGLVAGALGLQYVGVDLSGAQVSANKGRADAWHQDGTPLPARPLWVHGDALDHLAGVPDGTFDYALTCPPYWNRERYSDDPRDLSAMKWPEFLNTHAHIIRETVRCLRPDRFLTWAISDVRDHRGHLRGLPAHTVDAFTTAGAHLVNEQVLVEPAGLRAKTTRPPWEACRTTTRRHQFVLTFVKGDRRTATQEVRRAR